MQQRGAAIIKARGTSSAASAAAAALDHIHDWMLGTPADDWVSMAVPSDGSYGIPEGVIYSYPVTCKGGEYSIVQGLDISDFSRGKMQATHRELLEERDGVKDLIPLEEHSLGPSLSIDLRGGVLTATCRTGFAG